MGDGPEGDLTAGGGMIRHVGVGATLRGDVSPYFSAPFGVEGARDRQCERFHVGFDRGVIDQPSEGAHIATLATFGLFHHQLFPICFQARGRMSCTTADITSLEVLCPREYPAREWGVVWRSRVYESRRRIAQV